MFRGPYGHGEKAFACFLWNKIRLFIQLGKFYEFGERSKYGGGQKVTLFRSGEERKPKRSSGWGKAQIARSRKLLLSRCHKGVTLTYLEENCRQRTNKLLEGHVLEKTATVFVLREPSRFLCQYLSSVHLLPERNQWRICVTSLLYISSSVVSVVNGSDDWRDRRGRSKA